MYLILLVTHFHERDAIIRGSGIVPHLNEVNVLWAGIPRRNPDKGGKQRGKLTSLSSSILGLIRVALQ